MNKWHNQQTDALCDALLCLKTREECYAFLEDICTVREFLDISQRLTVADMLSRGLPYTAIREATGASTTTISRVSKCCDCGKGGYELVLSRREECGHA